MKLAERIQEDPIYKKYQRILEYIERNFDRDRTVKEARTLHTGRKSRSFKGALPDPQQIFDAQVKDMNARGSLTDLRSALYDYQSSLELAISTTRSQIISFHLKDSERFRLAADKKAVADRFVKRGLDLLASIESTINVIELFIKDIDQAGYGLRNLVDLLRILGPNNPSASI